MLNHALKYLSLGFSIIPLKPCGKEPMLPWSEFQSRRASEAEISAWFLRWPNANIGIVTGQISNLIVVDLDGQEGLDEANRLGLKSPLTVLTGKGRHLYYKWQPNVQNSVRLRPGIDIRSDNGFVVAPGSIHESGRRYRWLSPLTASNVMNLPAFPAAIFAETVSQTRKFEQKEEGWIAKALEEMKDGNIDNTLTSILGRLRHDGWTSSDAQAILERHALSAGAEEGHLEAKIENIWNRYESKINTSNTSYRLSNESSNMGELVIHSPTNPDSLKQFEQLQMESSTSAVGQLQTGYSKLDQMLQGGLKSSRLFTVAARTGTGKTNWIIGVARTLCESGKRVLLFSTETPYTEIWQRYVATLQDPRAFRDHLLFICDSFAPNIEKVEEAINETKPDVFMFDHINHVSEEQRELGSFMQGLNFLRRKYDCAGIVTAQLNRSADWIDLKSGEKVTPRMSMIKGSGTIEQASSRVLLLSETRVTPEMTEIVGNLDKNDNGPKGLVHFGLMNQPYKMVEL